MKAVIPAAGLGTRLLTVTKEQPKEMLPLFAPGKGGVAVKPVLQLVFEQLYAASFREFYFVVGRGKRAIEDHFTPDRDFVQDLRERGRESPAEELATFYRKLETSRLGWVNQSRPLGFGHAVLLSKVFVGNNRFLVHAGDAYILSNGVRHVERLTATHLKTKAAATIFLAEVADPRPHGVAEVHRRDGVTYVESLVEKPKKPPTNLAVIPVYLFEPGIFSTLQSIKPGHGGELQLTDAIQAIIRDGETVAAIELEKGEQWLDVGNPENFWEALESSHRSSRSV